MQALQIESRASATAFPFLKGDDPGIQIRVAEQELRSQMPLDLGQRLRMRFCEEKDIPQAVSLFDLVWKRESFRLWFDDLMSGRHPNVSFTDFTLVEDSETGRLVSLMGLISQTWVYGDIRFRCGQPEAIVTHPDYRRRGLIRQQLEVMHKLSQARGELVQVIWGNPWYYRQFGYEYALEGLWDTHKKVHVHQIPDRQNPLANPSRLRKIETKDYGFIQHIYEACENRSHIRAEKTFAEWRFQFEGWTPGAHAQREWRIIEDANGSLAGFLSFHSEPDSGGFGVHQMELVQHTGYLQIMPGILRNLWDLAIERNQGAQPSEIKLYLGQKHPAYEPLHNDDRLYKGDMQCLYIRVQDMVKLLRHIKPALDKNLAKSAASDFSGKLQISMYRSGIEITIDAGCISRIDPWKADSFWHMPSFPDLTFLQLVFGRRRCAELSDIYVDCNMDEQTALILDAMFPAFKGTMWLGN